MRRNWKSVQPISLVDALRLAKDYAHHSKQLSVERIADLMGVSIDVLYKWLATGRMPANLIASYEHACGCDFVTRWLAIGRNKLLVDIPSGRKASPSEMHSLQASLNDTVGQLLAFYSGKSDEATVLVALQSSLEGLAWHRQNVQQQENPQLDFGGQE